MEEGVIELASRRLATLEADIERDIDTFVGVGHKFMEIRDSRLYKETHRTFEEYMRERWHKSRAYAYRLIAAAKEDEMSPTGDKPKTEYEARKRREPAEAAPEPAADSEEGCVLPTPPQFRTRLKRIRTFVLAELTSSKEERAALVASLRRLIKKLEEAE